MADRAFKTPEPMQPAPQGYEVLQARSPFMENHGPFFIRDNGDGTSTVGAWVAPEISNATSGAHGGFLAAFADLALTIVTSGITLNLSIDYMRPAALGSWLEARVNIRKASSTLAFADAIIEAEGRAVARISGVFKPYVKRS